MPVLFVDEVDHLIDAQALPQVFSDKIFFLLGSPGHVTGAVDKEQFPAPAAGASEICGHYFYLALKSCIADRAALIIR